jgi:hypothetical protein
MANVNSDPLVSFKSVDIGTRKVCTHYSQEVMAVFERRYLKKKYHLLP